MKRFQNIFIVFIVFMKFSVVLGTESDVNEK